MTRPRLFVRLLIVLGLLALAATAWGRAGGGQSFSGGSHSSGGSSSGWHSSGGSSSSGGSADMPAPCMCLLVVLIIAVVVYSNYHKRNSASQGTSQAIEDRLAQRRAANQQSPQQIAEGLRRISARDPAFNADELLAQAQRLFVDLQHAWSLGAFDEVRRAMSDGLARRFTVQVALNRFWGKRNVTADVRVRDTSIVGVESDDELDTVHLRFSASARDCDVPTAMSDPQAFAKAAQAPASSFVETWSFVRRLNPGTRAGKLSEGRCPACGAPVPKQATVSCDYCKAILNSGSYDWVLAEITQESEFELRPARAVEGFARLKAADPALNRQVLEDRASLVFWKYIEALATGSTRPFARLCTTAALNELSAAQRKPSQALSQTAVGAVDLLLLASDADFDRARLELRWSTSGAGTGLARTSVLTLARKNGILTNAKTGMSTDRCHNCSAIQTDTEAATCSHCNALLSQDWAFEELVPIEAFKAHAPAGQPAGDLASHIGAIADPWERQRALAVMVAMARADGVVTDSEQRLLKACAQRWGIEPAKLTALLAAPMAELTDLTPKSLDQARVLFRALVAAALVDGRIDPEERKLLFTMADHLKISSQESQAILREMRDAVDRLHQG